MNRTSSLGMARALRASDSDSDDNPAQLAIVEKELHRSAGLSAARSVEFNSLRDDVSSARTANEEVVKRLQASLQRSEVEAAASRAEASQLRKNKGLASEQLEVAVVQREIAVAQREAAAEAVLEEEERYAAARQETESRLREEAQHEAARRRELESRLHEVEATLEEQRATAAASLSTSIALLADPSRASPERRAGESATSTALETASAAARRGAAVAGTGGGALLADHAVLTQQFHVLKRRFDSVVADKGKLQAEAARRDRELLREASALRSALLAAGAAGGRAGAAAVAAAPRYLAASALAAPSPSSPSLSPPPALRSGGGGSATGSGADPFRRRGGGASSGELQLAEAEASSLRRRLSDMSADNALLTQNFMMVKACTHARLNTRLHACYTCVRVCVRVRMHVRVHVHMHMHMDMDMHMLIMHVRGQARLSDVCAQKEAALSEMQLSCTQLETTLHTRLSAAMRAQQTILRSELCAIEVEIPPRRAFAARHALRTCLHGVLQARPLPRTPPPTTSPVPPPRQPHSSPSTAPP